MPQDVRICLDRYVLYASWRCSLKVATCNPLARNVNEMCVIILHVTFDCLTTTNPITETVYLNA